MLSAGLLPPFEDILGGLCKFFLLLYYLFDVQLREEEINQSR